MTAFVINICNMTTTMLDLLTVKDLAFSIFNGRYLETRPILSLLLPSHVKHQTTGMLENKLYH